MAIETKDWTAQSDNMPGSAAVRVSGTITVGNPGITPTLCMRKQPGDAKTLSLELTLEAADGMAVQVITDKVVRFEMAGDYSHLRQIEIYHDGALLTTITDVLITH